MEDDKLILRQDQTITVLHAVETMIRGTNGQYMSNANIHSMSQSAILSAPSHFCCCTESQSCNIDA